MFNSRFPSDKNWELRIRHWSDSLFCLVLLDWFSSNLFAAALAGKRLFDAFLLARFQVEGVFFNFLNDVFLLNLALEAPQRILDGLAILKSNFRHSIHPPSGCNRIPIITYFDAYGDVSLVFGPIRQALLSCEGHAYLYCLLRFEA